MRIPAPGKIPSLRVSGCNPNYLNVGHLFPTQNKIKQLRWWQKEAFDKLKNSRFNLMVGFCGCGKSIFQVALAIHDVIKSNYKQKQLIVVPQQHIGLGFISANGFENLSLELSGNNYDWVVRHNFCDDSRPSVIKSLKKWLLTDGDVLSKNNSQQMITGINAVCSHQALGLVWKTLTSEEKLKAIKYLTLRIDEAHHIKGVFDENDENMSELQKIYLHEEATNLGRICCFIFKNGNADSKIHLTTATPYRGDNHMMLSPKVASTFETYYLDWLDHFNTLGIKEFIFEYEEYETDPIQQIITNIKTELDQKHLIIVPSSGSKWRKNGNEVAELFQELEKIVEKNKILDLVSKKSQSSNKELLLKEPKWDECSSKYDVIVACMLGREGTDWCPCSRLHNTSCENSITLAVQTTGRPFRRFPGKIDIYIKNYIRQFPQPEDGITKRELLSDRTNALLICMQLDEMARPIKIPIILNQNDSDNNSNSETVVNLNELLGTDCQIVKQKLIEELECLMYKDGPSIAGTVESVISLFPIAKKNEQAVKLGLQAVALRLLSQEAKIKGIDPKYIRENGFDKICEKLNLGKSIFFGNYDANSWKNIRKILNNWEVMYSHAKTYLESK